MNGESVKLKYGDEIRQVTLQDTLGKPYDELLDVFEARFRVQVPRHLVRFSYKDSDGDEITFSTNEELCEVLSSNFSKAVLKFTVHVPQQQQPVNEGQGLSGRLQHEIRSTTPVPSEHSTTSSAPPPPQPAATEQAAPEAEDPPETPLQGDARPNTNLPHLNEFIGSLPQRTASLRDAISASVANRSTAGADFSALNDLPDVFRTIVEDIRQSLGQAQFDIAREVDKVKAEFAQIQQELREQRERTRASYRRGGGPHHHHGHAWHTHFTNPEQQSPRSQPAPAPPAAAADFGYRVPSSSSQPDNRRTTPMPGAFDFKDHKTDMSTSQTEHDSPSFSDLLKKLESYGLGSQDERVRHIALRVYCDNRDATLSDLVTKVLDRLHGDAQS